MAEQTKSSSPAVAIPPDAKPNGRPPETPAVPAKKFPRVEAQAKRGPGRPPKVSVERGKAGAQVPASRATDAPAAALASSSYSAKPADELTGMGVRGLMQLLGGTLALGSHFALKLPLLQAGEIWTFSKDELDRIEGPGGPFLEKYAPFLDAWALELDFAGAIIPIVGAKIFAVIAAKRALEAADKKGPAAAPRKAVTEIRPSSTEAAAAAPAQTETTTGEDARPAASLDPVSKLPDAFTHQRVDTSAEPLAL